MKNHKIKGIDVMDNKDHDSSLPQTQPMSLKNLDDRDSREFWEFIDKSVEEWRQQQPRWSREIQRERQEGRTQVNRTENGSQPISHCRPR